MGKPQKPPSDRSYPRVAHQAPARVRYSNGGAHESEAQTANVASNSVFFYTEAEITIGSTIEVILSLPAVVTGGKDRLVRCRAKVVRMEQRDPTGPIGIAAVFSEYEAVDEAE